MTELTGRPIVYDLGGHDIDAGDAQVLPDVDQDGEVITVHMGPMIKHLRAKVASAHARGVQDALAAIDAIRANDRSHK